MRLKENFVMHKSENQYILIDCTGNFSGLIKCNKTCEFILECLQNEITETELINKMLDKYDAPENIIKDNVHDIISKLIKVNAIDE